MGQSDQTIHLNKPQLFRFLNPQEGIGYDNPMYLKKVIILVPTLYDIDHIGLGNMTFIRSSAEVQANEEANRKRTDKMQMPFDYSKQNDQYKRNKTNFSNEETDVIIPIANIEKTENSNPKKITILCSNSRIGKSHT